VLPSLNSLYKNPSAVVQAVSPVKVAPKNAFSSSIFLEHATPGTPVTLEDITLEDSEDLDQDYTHQDYSSGLQVDQRDYSTTTSSSTRRPVYRTKITGSRFTGRGTKKKSIKKRKTRNIKSKK
jgi:hypothetical protein